MYIGVFVTIAIICGIIAIPFILSLGIKEDEE
ncbi:hypothetical protein [Staphylococcus phage PT1-9]